MQSAGLALAILLVFTGTAIADSVEERLQAVLSKIEAMVTKLALDDSLDTQETDALRADLAAVYRELMAIQVEMQPPAEPEPPAAQEADQEAQGAEETPEAAPPADENETGVLPESVADAQTEQWQTYPKAKAVVSPPDAAFNGWREAAGIDFRWGEYGQVIVEIANDGYLAQWTIDEAYHGNVNVSTQSQPDGDILIVVDDDLGQHQFLLQHGGLGPLLYQAAQQPQPVPVDAPV